MKHERRAQASKLADDMHKEKDLERVKELQKRINDLNDKGTFYNQGERE